jgi:hypothetical protein
MQPETLSLLFTIANNAVLPSWLLLAFVPRWAYTRRIALLSGVLVMSLAYAFLFSTNIALVLGGGNDGSGGGITLAGISKGFQNPVLALLGWVHYLAFDLFVGTWEAHDAQRHGISQWLVLPCLLATFMAGPVGLLMYGGLRVIRLKRLL